MRTKIKNKKNQESNNNKKKREEEGVAYKLKRFEKPFAALFEKHVERFRFLDK
jgi:hypothetical protein